MSDNYRHGESVRERFMRLKLEKIFEIANIALTMNDDERSRDALEGIWEIIDNRTFDLEKARRIRDGLEEGYHEH